MALLNSLTGSRSLNAGPSNDFTEGLIVTEYINGQPDIDNALILAGTFMPKEKLPTGVTQKVVKEHYSGNPYPVVHVTGAEDSDIEIKGTFNEYHITDKSLAGAAKAYKERLDDIVRRGNVVKVSLGDYFSKYCILIEANFEMFHLKKIDYTVKIMVIGDKLPLNYFLSDSATLDSATPNKELLSKIGNHLKLMDTKPVTIPVTVSDVISGAIAEVAEKVNVVTNFIDGAITDTEQIVEASFKALALIQNAKSFIVRSNRRIGMIEKKVFGNSTYVNSAAGKIESLKNFGYVTDVKQSNRSLNKTLSTLENIFKNYTKSVPLKKHIVGATDSLQRISIKYYGTSDYWNKIMTHNKLVSTDLIAGSIIEIPKI